MLDAKSIVKLQEQSDYGIKQLELLFQQTDDINQKILSDVSRSVKWKKDEIKRNIERITPAIATHVNLINSIGKEAIKNQPFWVSSGFLLSLQKFDDNIEKDAIVRLAYANELQKLPIPIIDLKMKKAIAENDYPMIFQCWLAGMTIIEKNYQPGHSAKEAIDFSLSDFILPDQKIVLEAINKCWKNISISESIASALFGRESTPLQRLIMARQEMPTTKELSAASSL